jgi:hypothetical protein
MFFMLFFLDPPDSIYLEDPERREQTRKTTMILSLINNILENYLRTVAADLRVFHIYKYQ